MNDHEDEVESVAFSPDGKTVVTASEDFTARIWPVYVADLMNVAQRLMQRSPAMFTSEERRRYGIE